MGEDIFADWKKQRFIVGDGYAKQYLDLFPNGHLIILTDFKFWTEYLEDLEEWCEQYGVKHSGMTLEIPSDKLLTMFSLRWA
jgi:hypothetical protein